MSCNFNAIKCKNCPKYNGCLLQMVYKNTVTLATVVENISQRLEKMDEANSISNTQISSLESDVSTVSSKLDDLIKSYNAYEYIPIVDKEK